MAIIAYYGSPNGRIFGRVTFASMEQARMECWNDSGLYGLHDTDAEETWLDRIWDRGTCGDAPSAPLQGQLRLFDNAQEASNAG